MRLLIVDDDLHLRKLVRTYAQLEQFQCEEATNGQEALKLLDAHPFDLVVLDVMMPGLSGFETLTQIRKTSQVPVIMLTARSEEYDKLLGFKLGVDDYESAVQSAETAEKAYQTADRKAQAGLLAARELEEEKQSRDRAAAREQSAGLELLKAQIQYQWAVDGLASST